MQFLKCLFCFWSIFRWLPVVFIVGIVSWSYYAYVFQLCLTQIDNPTKQSIFLIFYHFFLLMFIWSYYQTMFTTGKKPPNEFYLTQTTMYELSLAETEDARELVLEQYASNLPVNTRTYKGGIRYCEKCNLIKPDRCHHCTQCGHCILKMDHHCPWVNNCVSFSNYKYFLLFLFYSWLYCFYVAATNLEFFIKFWADVQSFKPARFHLLFLFFVAIMFSISVATLLIYHIYLTALNRTTLESFRAPLFVSGASKSGYDLGVLMNIKQVFGDSVFFAFIPIFTSKTDGTRFYSSYTKSLKPLGEATVDTSVPSISTNIFTNTHASLDNGYSFQMRNDLTSERLLSGLDRANGRLASSNSKMPSNPNC